MEKRYNTRKRRRPSYFDTTCNVQRTKRDKMENKKEEMDAKICSLCRKVTEESSTDMSDCTDTSVLPTLLLQYSSTVLEYLCTACTQAVKNINDITRQVEEVEQEILKRVANKVAQKKSLQSENKMFKEVDKKEIERNHSKNLSEQYGKTNSELRRKMISGKKSAASNDSPEKNETKEQVPNNKESKEIRGDNNLKAKRKRKDSIMERKGYKYLVRWSSYPEDPDTWELRSSIPAEIIRRYEDDLKLLETFAKQINKKEVKHLKCTKNVNQKKKKIKHIESAEHVKQTAKKDNEHGKSRSKKKYNLQYSRGDQLDRKIIRGNRGKEDDFFSKKSDFKIKRKKVKLKRQIALKSEKNEQRENNKSLNIYHKIEEKKEKNTKNKTRAIMDQIDTANKNTIILNIKDKDDFKRKDELTELTNLNEKNYENGEEDKSIMNVLSRNRKKRNEVKGKRHNTDHKHNSLEENTCAKAGNKKRTRTIVFVKNRAKDKGFSDKKKAEDDLLMKSVAQTLNNKLNDDEVKSMCMERGKDTLKSQISPKLFSEKKSKTITLKYKPKVKWIFKNPISNQDHDYSIKTEFKKQNPEFSVRKEINLTRENQHFVVQVNL